MSDRLDYTTITFRGTAYVLETEFIAHVRRLDRELASARAEVKRLKHSRDTVEFWMKQFDYQTDRIRNMSDQTAMFQSEIDRLEFRADWMAARLQRVQDMLRPTEFWPQAAAILANGTASSDEPPIYAQQLSISRHQRDAARAEASHLRASLEKIYYGPAPIGLDYMPWAMGIARAALQSSDAGSTWLEAARGMAGALREALPILEEDMIYNKCVKVLALWDALTGEGKP